jgi:hypothetical protein
VHKSAKIRLAFAFLFGSRISFCLAPSLLTRIYTSYVYQTAAFCASVGGDNEKRPEEEKSSGRSLASNEEVINTDAALFCEFPSDKESPPERQSGKQP